MEKPHPFYFPALVTTGVLICAGMWFHFKPSGRELSRLVTPAAKAQYLPDASGRLPADMLGGEKLVATSMTATPDNAPVVAAKKSP